MCWKDETEVSRQVRTAQGPRHALYTHQREWRQEASWVTTEALEARSCTQWHSHHRHHFSHRRPCTNPEILVWEFGRNTAITLPLPPTRHIQPCLPLQNLKSQRRHHQKVDSHPPRLKLLQMLTCVVYRIQATYYVIVIF